MKCIEYALFGSTEQLKWSPTDDALVIAAPQRVPNEIAAVFAISTQ